MDKAQHDGHRQRLREKFLQWGLDGFLDYEIVELLLTLGTPRKDCKQMAKKLIEKFGSLENIFDAEYAELQQVEGVGPSNSIGFKLFQAISERYLKNKLIASFSLDNPQIVFEYLKEKIGHEKKEHFVILFFDTKNNLIYDDVSTGTLNASLIHPREVFSKAILHNASHILIAHNHPSNDPTPSEEDFMTTNRLVSAGNIVGISVIDHIIVTEGGYVSFREIGRM